MKVFKFYPIAAQLYQNLPRHHNLPRLYWHVTLRVGCVTQKPVRTLIGKFDMTSISAYDRSLFQPRILLTVNIVTARRALFARRSNLFYRGRRLLRPCGLAMTKWTCSRMVPYGKATQLRKLQRTSTAMFPYRMYEIR